MSPDILRNTPHVLNKLIYNMLGFTYSLAGIARVNCGSYMSGSPQWKVARHGDRQVVGAELYLVGVLMRTDPRARWSGRRPYHATRSVIRPKSYWTCACLLHSNTHVCKCTISNPTPTRVYSQHTQTSLLNLSLVRK